METGDIDEWIRVLKPSITGCSVTVFLPFSSFILAGVTKDIWLQSKASQDEDVRSDPGLLRSLKVFIPE